MQTYPYLMRGRWFRPLLLGLLLSLNVCLALGAEDSARRPYDLPAGDAEEMLKQFAEQSGKGVLFSTGAFQGIRTKAVKGQFTAKEAIELMTAETALVVKEEQNSGAFAVRKDTPIEAKNVSRANAESGRPGRSGMSEVDERGEPVVKLDTFEVFAGKTLNMDIRRTQDDAQPYVVFERQVIEKSSAYNLEEFLRQRLTMSGSGASYMATTVGGQPAISGINLRGLGPNQTLILVDGRRLAGVATIPGSSVPNQPDINGIPLSAVERIEVLPASASGIYGGSATGGAINIIMRRDYAGFETKLSYRNTFDTDSAVRRVDVSGGLALNDGKTQVLFGGSYSDTNMLLVQDRDFVRSGRRQINANNPNYFFANFVNYTLGSTPNIRSANGALLQLKPAGGGATLSSAFTSVPVGYLGTAGDNGEALATNAGKFNLELSNTPQGQPSGRRSLLAAPTRESFFVTARHEFSTKLTAFAEFSGSNNITKAQATGIFGNFTIDQTAPNNPFNQSISVVVPVELGVNVRKDRNYERRVAAGMIAALPGGWKAELDTTWSRSGVTLQPLPTVSAAGSAAVRNGTLDVLKDPAVALVDFRPYLQAGNKVTPMRSTQLATALRSSGPLLNVPAGPVTLSGILEYTEGKVDPSSQFSPTGTLTVTGPPARQNVKSAYLETLIPIIAPAQNVSWARSMDVQIAGRFDDYWAKGGRQVTSTATIAPTSENSAHSVNPTIAAKWTPLDGLAVRAGVGTGFLPPSVTQFAPQSSPGLLGFLGLVDPKRGNTPVTGDSINIAGKDLKPERSVTTTAGFILTPKRLSGLRISVDYVHLEKTDAIVSLPTQSYINNEDTMPGRVTRAPLEAGSPYTAGAITVLDSSSINAAKVLVEALDFSVEYVRKLETAGTVRLSVNATRQLQLRFQNIAGAPAVEYVGYANGDFDTSAGFAGKWKAAGGVEWTSGPWTIAWNTRYIAPYTISLPTFSTAVSQQWLVTQGNGGQVRSHIYHDFSASYKFAGTSNSTLSRLLARTEVSVGVINLFNQRPAFDVSNQRYYGSYVADPSLASFAISVKRQF